MKVSIAQLQKYFDAPLPSAEELDAVFTFHSFEIDARADDWLDISVLPNRAADCLSHRGIARELSALLSVPVARDPLRTPEPSFPKTSALRVVVEDPKKCLRYMGALMRGVKVGPSPDWLKEALGAMGQQSINNVVDAANYVMLHIGQPLHIFDVNKLSRDGDAYKIVVRSAHEGERLTTLSGEELVLSEDMLLIADGNSNTPLALAGVKGGMAALVDETTTDLVIEAASFDGPSVRRAAQSAKLFTDASLRFQNEPSSALAAYGMREVVSLIADIAGGELEGVTDVYGARAQASPARVRVSLEKINGLLGSDFSHEQVQEVFTRLAFSFDEVQGGWEITPPFERTDITIPEDLVEEVGRIIGYDTISPKILPEPSTPSDQAYFRGIERVKDFLLAQGFTEISTQTFAKDGDIILANPLDKTKPALRTTLTTNMQDALTRARRYAPRVLGPNSAPKLFEIGTIFPGDGERLAVETTEPVSDIPKIIDDGAYVPKHFALGRYTPFSIYPCMLRDIAVWTPEGTKSGEVEALIAASAGALLVRADLFDSFTKGTRVSYAFRLVFESPKRTLTDEEIHIFMEKITKALGARSGYEVR